MLALLTDPNMLVEAPLWALFAMGALLACLARWMRRHLERRKR